MNGIHTVPCVARSRWTCARKVALNIHPLVVCTLLGEHVDHLVGAEGLFIGRKESDTVSFSPYKIVSEPIRIGINEFCTEASGAEHQDGRVVVLGETLDLFPEGHEVYLDVPLTTSLTYTSILNLLNILIASCSLGFQTPIGQITDEAVNRFGGQVLHLFQAVAV